jgi:ribonuclease I
MDNKFLDVLCAIKDPTFLRSPRRRRRPCTPEVIKQTSLLAVPGVTPLARKQFYVNGLCILLERQDQFAWRDSMSPVVCFGEVPQL